MEKFLLFVADIFGADVSELSVDTAYGVYEKWDSMMQLQLIMEVEETYDVEIPIDEVPNIKTLKDLYQYTCQS